jgi:stage II sporulation protein M
MFLKKAIVKHIKSNMLIYFLVLVFFIAGIAAGAFTVDALSSVQKDELINYFQSFFSVLNTETVQSAAVFKQSLLNNIQFIVLIWVLGITIIGIPLILLIVGIKGFIVGFSVSFLVEGMGFRGLILALVSILPQNLLIVPSIIAAGVLGISFSVTMLGRRKSRSKKSFSSELISYSANFLPVLAIVVVGSLIEGYITPVFMKLFSN